MFCTHVFVLLFFFTYGHASRIVIVGGGTSGCVLAARLCSSLPRTNITLLERATRRSEEAEFLVRSPRQAWDARASALVVETFSSRPGKGVNYRAENVIAGNTLGGCSATNGMQFIVPREGSIESWLIPDLNTSSSRYYFKRACHKLGIAPQSGKLKQRHVGAYLRAARKAGFTGNYYPFDASPSRDMFRSRLPVTRNGRRVDACTAYLKPVQEGICRTNLKLVEGATVIRIMLSAGKHRRATGLKYVVTGTNRTRLIRIPKDGEIIISAGPYGSPKLLQLSGIGPKRVLRNADIPMRVKLPVGVKTQARPIVSILISIPGVPLEPSNNSTLLNSPRQRRKWEAGGGGVLGTAPFMANGRDLDNGYIEAVGNFFPSLVDQKLLSASCVGNVKSRGFIRIKSKDPMEAPDVQLSLLSRKSDLRRIQRCLNRIKLVTETLPSRYNASLMNPKVSLITEKWIRDNAMFAHQLVGGCKVGKVLTGRLEVKGISRLRVVDASSIKHLPISAGPMASTYMIAEFMADVISKTYRGMT